MIKFYKVILNYIRKYKFLENILFSILSLVMHFDNLKDKRCNIPHRPNGEGLCVVYVHAHLQSNTRPFGGSAASEGMGTPRLSMLMLEQSQDG